MHILLTQGKLGRHPCPAAIMFVHVCVSAYYVMCARACVRMCAAKLALLSQAGATQRRQMLVMFLCVLQAAMSNGSVCCATAELHILSCA